MSQRSDRRSRSRSSSRTRSLRDDVSDEEMPRSSKSRHRSKPKNKGDSECDDDIEFPLIGAKSSVRRVTGMLGMKWLSIVLIVLLLGAGVGIGLYYGLYADGSSTADPSGLNLSQETCVPNYVAPSVSDID